MTDNKRTKSPRQYDDGMELGELFRALWADKWLISGFALVAAFTAVIVALMLPNIFRAEALLTPNDQQGASELSGLASQYGGLASLAGINLGGAATNKTAIGIEVLKSRKFISEFIERHDILVPLMAADGWDPKSGELKIDSDVYDVAADKWVRDVSSPRKTIPSLQEAYKEFRKKLSVSQDKKTRFVTVAVSHYSPTIAKQWVDWLVEDVNRTVMKKDVAEAEQAIAYLNEQIKNTSLAELQNVFSRLIEEQTKTVMLAKVTPEYMFRTLDPAIAPELRAKPRRSFIVVLYTLLGGMVGVFVVLIRNSISTNSK